MEIDLAVRQINLLSTFQSVSAKELRKGKERVSNDN